MQKFKQDAATEFYRRSHFSIRLHLCSRLGLHVRAASVEVAFTFPHCYPPRKHRQTCRVTT